MKASRRHFLQATLATAVAASALSAGVARAQGSGLLAKAKAAGVMRVGTAGNEPNSIILPDRFTGEALESAQLIVRDMGIPKIEPVITPFASIIPALQAGRIDMISSGLSITPARCDQVAFSDPYFCKLTNLMVKKGNPLGLKRFEDIAKNPQVKFGYTLGGTEGPQARAAGVADAQISTFPSAAELVDALRSGRIDALALPDQQVNWRLSKGGWESKELETPGSFIPKVNGKDQLTCPAFAFRRADSAFRDEFNKVLAARKQDGSILKIVTQFGVTEQGFRIGEKMTAEQLCKAG
jgi:polar amino acid transport system substrate-binding protein